MRLSTLILASALGVASATASASDPCAPPPTRPVHVAAFATQAPVPESPTPGTLSSAAPAKADELAIQAGCLAWETSHARRAEFIGTVPIGAAASSSVIATPGSPVSVQVTPPPALPFLSTPIGAVSPEATSTPEDSRFFTLGLFLTDPR